MISSIDHQLKFQQLFWFVIMGFSAIVIGYALASNMFLLAFGLMGLFWLFLLPYHTKLSIYLSVATFSSALIVPLFPGRPYLWEFAALLGWSGLIITVSMRQIAPDTWRVFRAHRWLFIGVIGYCLVLLIIVFYRGFGLRILGSDQMGGRYYFQQVTCAIFPFLFVMCRPGEKTLLKLFTIQCLLTTTYLVSDFVLSRAPESMFFLLQFFELSGDAVNFEMRAERFGIRRWQSFYVVSLGFLSLLLIRNHLRDFFGRRSLYLIPVTLLLAGVGMLSGHRYLAVIIVGMLIFLAYAERFFDFKNTMITIIVAVAVFGFTYLSAERLPLAVQRTISFMPGITINPQAKIDAEGTLEVRRVLRKIGIQLAPQYFWIGRGFGLDTVDLSWQWDPTTITGHINQGRFYNGFVGLMVNTGVFGTFFILLFLGTGLHISLKIAWYLRAHGCNDNFLRLSAVVAGFWVANTIGFLFLHGDSEYAMKTFSLQAGMLVVCYEHIRRRQEAAAEAPAELTLAE